MTKTQLAAGRSRALSLFSCAALVVMLGVSASAQDAKTDREEETTAAETDQTVRPEIRSFDLDTLSALGREIHRHDSLAWRATDVLFAHLPQEKLATEASAGWVVDTNGEEPLVRFLREVGDQIEAAYDIVFPVARKPHVVEPDDRTLSSTQIGAFRAYRSAINTLIDRKLPWCGGNPNHVELPDPDGSGFLVYILRAKPTGNIVPVGGHYRVTVSADGQTVEQVDQLFASCLEMPRNQGVPEGSELVALSMTHLISPTPLETHVFLSLQEDLPFMLITPDAQMWNVADGVIANANKK